MNWGGEGVSTSEIYDLIILVNPKGTLLRHSKTIVRVKVCQSPRYLSYLHNPVLNMGVLVKLSDLWDVW